MSSVEHVCSNISNYSIHPDIDFQRNRKISSQKLISLDVYKRQDIKVVDQINVLAKSIMDITGQTNLLALNASIEAEMCIRDRQELVLRVLKLIQKMMLQQQLTVLQRQ